MEGQETQIILLWDGTCDFCCRCVEWMKARDTTGRIKPVPYQDVPSPPMTEAFRVRCGRSIQLFLPGRSPLSGGKAALAVLSLLGWKKTAACLSRPPLVWGIDVLYRLIARNRGFIGRVIFR